MSSDRVADARRRGLRSLAKAGGQAAVASEDLLWLLDECSRLQQSNDRLRRQNRRLRLRLQDAGGEIEPELAGDD
jgi:hypothetical protein